MPKLETRSDSPSTPARPILIGPRIWDELDSYDKNLKAKFVRTFRWISRDIAHPSLRLELVKAGKDSFYRVRVDPQYRIHFELVGEYYLILAVGPHRLQGIG